MGSGLLVFGRVQAQLCKLGREPVCEPERSPVEVVQWQRMIVEPLSHLSPHIYIYRQKKNGGLDIAWRQPADDTKIAIGHLP
jgi:hypothetical protein